MLGTAKKREEVRPPTDARGLAEIVLSDWRGRDVRLGDTWADEPVVLVFLRHYG